MKWLHTYPLVSLSHNKHQNPHPEREHTAVVDHLSGDRLPGAFIKAFLQLDFE